MELRRAARGNLVGLFGDRSAPDSLDDDDAHGEDQEAHHGNECDDRTEWPGGARIGLDEKLDRVVLEQEDDVDDLAEAAEADGAVSDHGGRRRRFAQHRDLGVHVLGRQAVHIIIRAENGEGQEQAPGDDTLAREGPRMVR